jgi:hypothetical protein
MLCEHILDTTQAAFSFFNRRQQKFLPASPSNIFLRLCPQKPHFHKTENFLTHSLMVWGFVVTFLSGNTLLDVKCFPFAA